MTDIKALIAEARLYDNSDGLMGAPGSPNAKICDIIRRLAAALEEATVPEGWRVVYRKDDFEVWQEAPGAWLVADEPRHRDFGDFPTARKAMAALDEEDGMVEIVNHMPSTFPDYDEYTLDSVTWQRASSNVIRCTRAQARHCAFRRVVRPLHVAREQDGHTPPPDAQKAPIGLFNQLTPEQQEAP